MRAAAGGGSGSSCAGGGSRGRPGKAEAGRAGGCQHLAGRPRQLLPRRQVEFGRPAGPSPLHPFPSPLSQVQRGPGGGWAGGCWLLRAASAGSKPGGRPGSRLLPRRPSRFPGGKQNPAHRSSSAPGLGRREAGANPGWWFQASAWVGRTCVLTLPCLALCPWTAQPPRASACSSVKWK